jgi:hypothetical protein
MTRFNNMARHAAILLLITAFVMPQHALFAEVNIYLISRFESEGEVRLCDVARIEAGAADAARIGALPVMPALYADGFLDRKELEAMVKDRSAESIFIYGGAVKILAKKGPAATGDEELSPAGELQVKAGDAVGVLIKGRGISVKLTGSAVEDGRMGDNVRVRIKGNRTLKGRVAENKMVEISL